MAQNINQNHNGAGNNISYGSLPIGTDEFRREMSRVLEEYDEVLSELYEALETFYQSFSRLCENDITLHETYRILLKSNIVRKEMMHNQRPHRAGQNDWRPDTSFSEMEQTEEREPGRSRR